MTGNIPIFVINLHRRPDRLERIVGDLERLGLKATRVPAVDARTVSDAELATRVDRGREIWKMGRGAEACVLSHCRALEMFLYTHAPTALILEDDARLAADLPLFAALPLDWWPGETSIVKLGRAGGGRRMFGKEIARRAFGRQLRPIALWSAGAAGYMIDRSGAEAVLAECRGVRMMIDQFLFDLRVSEFARNLRPVQILPALVESRSYELGSDIAESMERSVPGGWRQVLFTLRWDLRRLPRKSVAQLQYFLGRTERLRADFAHRVDN